MAFGGEDDRRGKRKLTEPRDKQAPRRGRGRTVVDSNSATVRGDVKDRERREQLI